MKRTKLANLETWRVRKSRRPIILKGARQVGKTWLAREFGKSFRSFVEFNFERDPALGDLFMRSLDPKRLIRDLSAAAGQRITPGETLLFLDEIQQSTAALKSLRYFYEEMPALHVIAAGSLLNMVLDTVPTGVGRISYTHLYPLSFAEFLDAADENLLRELIFDQALHQPLPAVHHDKLLDLVRSYMILGGMPAVVDSFFRDHDYLRSQEIQDGLLQSFFDDFHKYAKTSDLQPLAVILRSVPLQLGAKFKYASADPGIRSRELSRALTLLEMAGLVHKVYQSRADGLPLASRIRTDRFKVVFFDTGLAQRLLNVNLRDWILDVSLSAVTRGAVAEQFVGQELATWLDATPLRPLTYWHREARASNAEVDYLLDRDGTIWPVEVKDGRQGGLKSLHLFLQEKGLSRGLKVSRFGFSDDGTVVTVPLYGLERLFTPRDDRRWCINPG